MKVLIAEDDATSLTLIKSFVEELGFAAILSRDGAEAWKAIKEHRPEICILDWEMPAMTGVELCEKIHRRSEEFPCQKIMLTARDSQNDLIVALRAGADDYLIKPVDKAQLNLRLKIARMMVEEKQLVESGRKTG